MAILGSFICGWMFLLSLTFSMQSPADGVAGVQQVTGGAMRCWRAWWPLCALLGGAWFSCVHVMLVTLAVTALPCLFALRSCARLVCVFPTHDAPCPPSRLPWPPPVQIFMSVFSSRWGSFEGAASFQLIVFLASNLCGIFCVTSNRCAPPGGTLQLRERALAGATAANSNCARLLPRSLSPQAARVVSLPWQRPWPPRPAGPRPAAPPRRSRMLYAFARDHGVLGSRWWKQVSNATGTPVNSIIGMWCEGCAGVAAPGLHQTQLDGGSWRAAHIAAKAQLAATARDHSCPCSLPPHL